MRTRAAVLAAATAAVTVFGPTVANLHAQGLTDSTMVILTAKHGNNPVAGPPR